MGGRARARAASALSAIRNSACVQMQQRTDGGGELPHKIEHEAKRAGEVVKRLRDFFRDGTSAPRTCQRS